MDQLNKAKVDPIAQSRAVLASKVIKNLDATQAAETAGRAGLAQGAADKRAQQARDDAAFQQGQAPVVRVKVAEPVGMGPKVAQVVADPAQTAGPGAAPGATKQIDPTTLPFEQRPKLPSDRTGLGSAASAPSVANPYLASQIGSGLAFMPSADPGPVPGLIERLLGLTQQQLDGQKQQTAKIEDLNRTMGKSKAPAPLPFIGPGRINPRP